MPAHGPEHSPSRPPLGVALVGFGTVGQAVARILCNGSHDRLRLTHVCNRRIDRKRADWVPAGVTWTDDIDAVLHSDADVVVELIGGRKPAADWIRRALEAGKSVVTANKQVIAEQGAELEVLARSRGSVCASRPPWRAAFRSFMACRRAWRVIASSVCSGS